MVDKLRDDIESEELDMARAEIVNGIIDLPAYDDRILKLIGSDRVLMCQVFQYFIMNCGNTGLREKCLQGIDTLICWINSKGGIDNEMLDTICTPCIKSALRLYNGDQNFKDIKSRFECIKNYQISDDLLNEIKKVEIKDVQKRKSITDSEVEQSVGHSQNTTLESNDAPHIFKPVPLAATTSKNSSTSNLPVGDTSAVALASERYGSSAFKVISANKKTVTPMQMEGCATISKSSCVSHTTNIHRATRSDKEDAISQWLCSVICDNNDMEQEPLIGDTRPDGEPEA